MLMIVLVMIVIIAVAALTMTFAAYPHRGQDVPKAPWLGEAMNRAVEAMPTLEGEEGGQWSPEQSDGQPTQPRRTDAARPRSTDAKVDRRAAGGHPEAPKGNAQAS